MFTALLLLSAQNLDNDAWAAMQDARNAYRDCLATKAAAAGKGNKIATATLVDGAMSKCQTEYLALSSANLKIGMVGVPASMMASITKSATAAASTRLKR